MSGCDLVFDCIGRPMDRISDHPATARNIAVAVKESGARCVHVSSYWAYLPVQHLPVSEEHARKGGNRAIQMRREAEDTLQSVGAAVVNLPDFYGPEVHSSTLQQALAEAAVGQTVNWVGAPLDAREYVFVPDAMKAVADLAFRNEAYGERWIVPTAGPLTLQQAGEIAQRHLGTRIQVRSAGMFTLRLLSFFVPQIRLFLPMAPHYLSPIQYDGSKLKKLLGDVPVTPYEVGIPQTLDWIAQPKSPAT